MRQLKKSFQAVLLSPAQFKADELSEIALGEFFRNLSLAVFRCNDLIEMSLAELV